jgi:tetratricopeptide (TPR) repeat protein
MLVIFLLLAIILSFVSGCSHAIPRFGIGGRYVEAKGELTKGRGGNIDKAILDLEAVVREEPTYQDSLTLLGRAYYKKGRYEDTRAILQRALVVNKDDEIAWVVLGLAQMKLGDDQKGLESLKGGLTLLSKAMRDSYRGFSGWDVNGSVRTSLRRSVLLATKGSGEKENLIQATEILLSRIDDEEWRQTRDQDLQRRRDASP